MQEGPALPRRPFRYEAALLASGWRRKPWLQLPDVRRLVALGALDDIELDTVTLGQAAESLRLNRGEVNENVLAVFLRDEAKAFGVVEPLHGTLAHLRCFLSGSIGSSRLRSSLDRIHKQPRGFRGCGERLDVQPKRQEPSVVSAGTGSASRGVLGARKTPLFGVVRR